MHMFVYSKPLDPSERETVARHVGIPDQYKGPNGAGHLRTWRTIALVAVGVCAAQAIAICTVWASAMHRVGEIEMELSQVGRDTSAMMMALADMQNSAEEQKDWNRLQEQALEKMLELRRKVNK